MEHRDEMKYLLERLFLFKYPARPPSLTSTPLAFSSARGLVKLAQILLGSQTKPLPSCIHSAAPTIALQ